MRNGAHQLAKFCKMIFHISKYIVPLSWWNKKIRVMNIHETEKVIHYLGGILVTRHHKMADL